MGMKILTLIATVCACIGQTPASPPVVNHADFWSADYPNGRYWNNLDIEKRAFWLVAYRQGLDDTRQNALVDCYPEAAAQVLSERHKAIMARLYPAGLNIAEVGMSLDTFFQTPENRPIPIRFALFIVSRRATGVAGAVIDKDVERLRQVWNGRK
jgi:hypothetical protein